MAGERLLCYIIPGLNSLLPQTGRRWIDNAFSRYSRPPTASTRVHMANKLLGGAG
jgi:hypothetical protein